MTASPDSTKDGERPSGLGRWVIYQRERFPVLAHGPLILAFSLSALCFSALLRGSAEFPARASILVAFFTSLFSFLHLRIADEFKDFEEDSKYRPYRAVPRGLVKLRELGVLWAVTACLQVALAVSLNPRLLAYLAITWTYLGLMSHEFFCRRWLKAHPFTYMWTHMLIMPLIDFYATACDWLPRENHAPNGLIWFVIVSFFNGFVLEIGRKMRAPEDEEQGVETYSFMWGRAGAVRGWWFVQALTAGSGWWASRLIGFETPFVIWFALLAVVSITLGARYIRKPARSAAKWFEAFSGVWTLSLYLMLGIIPLLLRWR